MSQPYHLNAAQRAATSCDVKEYGWIRHVGAKFYFCAYKVSAIAMGGGYSVLCTGNLWGRFPAPNWTLDYW